MPAVGEGWLPSRRADHASDVGAEDVYFVRAARHSVNGRASRKMRIADCPPSAPVRRDGRVPRSGVDMAVRADDKNVELVAAAGDYSDRSPRSARPPAISHQPCQPSAKAGSQAALRATPAI